MVSSKRHGSKSSSVSLLGSPDHEVSKDLDAGIPRWTPRAPSEEE